MSQSLCSTVEFECDACMMPTTTPINNTAVVLVQVCVQCKTWKQPLNNRVFLLVVLPPLVGARQQAAGLVLTDTELMTGLPEYRNGGLLLDMGLLQAKHAEVTGKPHGPEEEVRLGFTLGPVRPFAAHAPGMRLLVRGLAACALLLVVAGSGFVGDGKSVSSLCC